MQKLAEFLKHQFAKLICQQTVNTDEARISSPDSQMQKGATWHLIPSSVIKDLILAELSKSKSFPSLSKYNTAL